MLIPSSGNAGSPSKIVPDPNFSCSNHRASFALTTNQPSAFGTRPASVFSKDASGTIVTSSPGVGRRPSLPGRLVENLGAVEIVLHREQEARILGDLGQGALRHLVEFR